MCSKHTHSNDRLARKVLRLCKGKCFGEQACIPAPDFALLEETPDIFIWWNDAITRRLVTMSPPVPTIVRLLRYMRQRERWE